MSPILHTLTHRLEQLPVQERKLAESILQSPGDVLHLGIRELAERCGVSPATVTRFCKSLHFKGYPDFKMKLVPPSCPVLIVTVKPPIRTSSPEIRSLVSWKLLRRIIPHPLRTRPDCWISASWSRRLHGCPPQAALICTAWRLPRLWRRIFIKSSFELAKIVPPSRTRTCRLPLPPRLGREMSPLPSPIRGKHRKPSRLCAVHRNREPEHYP